eukprot:3393515-Amphidinium_carterae.1
MKERTSTEQPKTKKQLRNESQNDSLHPSLYQRAGTSFRTGSHAGSCALQRSSLTTAKVLQSIE